MPRQDQLALCLACAGCQGGPTQAVSGGVIFVRVVFWSCGRTVSHCLSCVAFVIVFILGGWVGVGVGVGVGAGFGITFGCCGSSHGSALHCCCSGPFIHSRCIFRACLDACRQLLATGSSCLSLDIALARIFISISGIPVPHSTLSLWPSSHFLSQSSNYWFMPSHCVSSHVICASSILAILRTVWCNRAT